MHIGKLTGRSTAESTDALIILVLEVGMLLPSTTTDFIVYLTLTV